MDIEESQAKEVPVKAKPKTEQPAKNYPKQPRPSFGEHLEPTADSVSKLEGKYPEAVQEILERDVKAIEDLYTKNGVDFSRIQIEKVLADREAGKPIDFETFSPYISDYNLHTGEIWRDKLMSADSVGLELSKTFRELFPKARLVSLYDEYNTVLPDTSNPRGIPTEGGKQIVVSEEVKANFKTNIVNLLKEKGSISQDAKEGQEYAMISESSKENDAIELVNRLKEKGHIQEEGGKITFVNDKASDPRFKKVELRAKNGKWFCEALDASSFLKPENLEITHIVVLSNQFKDQQDKVWEILRVLGIKGENYHNIFYDENVDPQTAAQTIKDEFAKVKL